MVPVLLERGVNDVLQFADVPDTFLSRRVFLV